MSKDSRGAIPRPGQSYAGRMSRRRFTAGAATFGVAAAAAGLVACSSSKNTNTNGSAKPATSAAQSGAATSATAGVRATAAGAAASNTPAALDSTKGKPGGTLKYYVNTDPGGLTSVDKAYGYHFNGLTQSALLGQSWGQESVAFNDFTKLEPDLAQALPEQPDDQTFVFKLRPGVKFSNGRALTADDVVYSYNRYATYDKSVTKSKWQTWLDSVQAPDAQTVTVKAKFPFADGLVSMAGHTDGYILAKEHEEGPDAASTMVGSGPYLYVSYQPPTTASFKKNPEYYLKPYPYFDNLQLFTNTDPVGRITSFITKQVHMPWLVHVPDRDQIKQQRPDAKIQSTLNWAPSFAMRQDKPPFNDARVRQALSMSIDRKQVWATDYQGEGRPDQWFNVMYKDLFGTSEVQDLGDAAKYWNYDPQAAKQLLAAAGVTLPIETQVSHWDAANNGQWFPDVATLVAAGWKSLGIANVKDNNLLAAQHQATAAVGQYEGMDMGITTSLNQGAPQYALNIHDQWYWGPNGEHSGFNNGYVNDPQLSALVEKQVRQVKLDDRKQTYRDMEKIIAAQQYKLVMYTTLMIWFYDPSLQNVRMAPEIGSRRYDMRWWFA